jgi:Cu(I)/Ag(I) efflux system membrane protein CusA/SilA
MIDAIITFSVRHREAVIVAGAALAALGVWAAWDTPVDAIPDLSENQVIVFTEWNGHGPREIEDQVTYPVTLALRGLAGVRTLRSSSDVGFSTISVIFGDEVAPGEARRRVAERLSGIQAGLPRGAASVLGPDSPATGQIFWYALEGGGLDLGRLRSIQDWYVRPQLGSVPGVAEVSSVGGFRLEYEVAPDPERMRLLGITCKGIGDAIAASNAAAAGHVVVKGNAEYVVRGVHWLGASTTPGDESFDARRAISDLESVLVDAPGGGTIRLAEVAKVSIAPGFRRGVMEKDGNEVTGGVVLMARGENSLELTRRIKAKIRELQAGLPPGVRIVPTYDRTPLIEGAIETVSGTVVEGMISASLCVLLILLHFRTSLVIAGILPLAASSSFLVLAVLRRTGLLDVPANAMSLAGIAISIGVLVDSSVVMAENVMHRLREQFGGARVTGDVRDVVLAACLSVGRPIVFSVAIMLLSFLPVFALGGVEGRMFHPLAYTKTFALASVAVLSITLVPALCTVFIRGRLRSETENPLVRGVIEVYRPVLSFLLDRPVAMAWILGVTFLLGVAPLANRPVFLGVLALGLIATSMLAATRWAAWLAPASLVLIALAADRLTTPIGREFLTPLDEGMVMDMPITVPRASVAESLDDLKARDMVLCHFPEVDMVVGKAGRAETPTDPAPMDMIESMVNFRPRAFWPRRKLRVEDARRQTSEVLDALIMRGVVEPPSDRAARAGIIADATTAALAPFDQVSREFAYQRNQEMVREGGGISPTSIHPSDPVEASLVPRWRRLVERLDAELLARAAPIFTRFAIDQLLDRSNVIDADVRAHQAAAARVRAEAVARLLRPHRPATGGHHHGSQSEPGTNIEPQPILDGIRSELSGRFGASVILWQVRRDELVGFGGELDVAVQMPGWTNVWTMPIQNRVDMLSTGVNTPIGIRVLGRNLEDVVRGAEEVARVVKTVPGAVDVIADPIRGKPYIEVRLHRERAARLGVRTADVNELIETALAGRVVTWTEEGRERHPVVVRYPRALREDEQSVRSLLVPAHGERHGAETPPTRARWVPLSEVAQVRVVEGPATIKGENGLLRSYVRLSARGRDAVSVVEDARAAIARDARLPSGVFPEFTGQFEHQLRARRTLIVVVPVVIALIFAILYWTYHDLADAALMMLAVPGAIAGGLFFQWLMGLKLSVTVWVGYIACFGMATSTGIIMLVYLREAVARGGGLRAMSLADLRQAVLDGAVHRLRPKLLTEGTVVLGLAPMLWSTGVASEVIRPMAAPVLGGILVADEVIDLFLPILFYWVRRRRWSRIHSAMPPSPNEPVDVGVQIAAGG